MGLLALLSTLTLAAAGVAAAFVLLGERR
jgi:hypothetical protein